MELGIVTEHTLHSQPYITIHVIYLFYNYANDKQYNESSDMHKLVKCFNKEGMVSADSVQNNVERPL